MRLTPPKQITWWIGIILVVLAIIGALVPTTPVVGEYAVWLGIASGLLLVIAVATKGL